MGILHGHARKEAKAQVLQWYRETFIENPGLFRLNLSKLNLSGLGLSGLGLSGLGLFGLVLKNYHGINASKFFKTRFFKLY